jgi:hypothetical protein
MRFLCAEIQNLPIKVRNTKDSSVNSSTVQNVQKRDQKQREILIINIDMSKHTHTHNRVELTFTWATSLSGGKGIFCFLYNPEFHYQCKKLPPLEHKLGQINDKIKRLLNKTFYGAL